MQATQRASGDNLRLWRSSRTDLQRHRLRPRAYRPPVPLHLRCNTEYLDGEGWIDVANVPVSSSLAAQRGDDR